MLRRALGRGWLLAALLFGFVGPLGPPPGSAAAAITVDAPASIDATGAQDVTAALTAFLSRAPAGATVRLAASGHYRIDGTVHLNRARGIVLDGQGATLFAPTDGSGAVNAKGRPVGSRLLRSRAHLVVSAAAGLTVRNLQIKGPNAAGTYQPTLEAQAGVVIRRSNGVVLDLVSVSSTFGDAVYVAGGSTEVDIRNSVFDHNGRQGLAVVGGAGVTVEHSEIRSPGRSAIDLEPAGGAATGIHVHDNRIVGATNTFVAALGAGAQVGDVWIEHNEVSGGRGLTIAAGVPAALRTGFHVIGNTGMGTSEGLDGALMSFTSFDGVEVRGNRQTVAAGVVPVSFTNSCHTTVTDNSFGSRAAEVRTTGDCTTVGAAPARRTPTTRPGSRAGRVRRRTTPTTAPRTVVVTRTVHTTSSLGVALAFLGGIAAGAGGVYLSQYLRRRERSARPVPGDPDPGASEEPDRHDVPAP